MNEEEEDYDNIAENRGSIEDEPAVKVSSADEFPIEEAGETIAKQKQEAETGHDAKEAKEAREQTIRVVVDQKKPKKKNEEKLATKGLTDEEKKDYRQARIDERRLNLEERKLRIEKKKRYVEDEQLKETINFPEKIGVYKRTKLLVNKVTPQRVETQVRASASARPFNLNEMVGSAKRVRENPPYNPVVASAQRRANYFAGYTPGPQPSKPAFFNAQPKPNYFAGPRLSVGKIFKPKTTIGKMSFKARRWFK
jgi:hypothetical protein